MKLNFKRRKVFHYTLLLSIIILQFLIGLIIYNEVFNESKLEELEAELYLSEQASYFSDLTKENYIEAQNNLQNFFRTKDQKYLVKYNDALTNLNENIQNLSKTAEKSSLFSLYLEREKYSNLSVSKINSLIDSLRNVEIPEIHKIKEENFKLNSIQYKDVLDSIHIETNLFVDSLERKNLISRLGNAFSGKVDVQKEKLNTTLTLKHGKKSVSGNIEEQFAYVLKRTNDYYQKEFLNYKARLSKLKNNESDFFDKNNELLNYSSILLKKYNDALVSFTNDARNKFQEQYKTNKLIRNYTIIGLVGIMIIISVVLVLLTRMAFEYEKRLLKAQGKIKENLTFKNRIVSMISHEIRSPLNIISIYSKGIRKQVNDVEVQESLKSIEFTTNSLTLLANQILDFSQSEHQKLSLNKTYFNLETELNAILKTLSSFVETNENKLHVKNNVAQNTMVHSDLVKIHQLFYNIVGNANKFTHNGNIYISIEIGKVENNKLTLFVEIKDDGLGIDEEDLKHIFENYRQGKTLTDVKNIGVGLGLSLCKEIVELFNGVITVSSKKNKETKVSFYLILDE